MTQSNARLVRRKRKKTSQMDAYDALPAIMRAAYQEGPNQFCSVYALNVYRKNKAKYGAEYVAQTMAKQMMEGHQREIARAIPWSSDPRNPSSPHIRAGATMQLSGRPPVVAQPEPQATELPRQAALL
jgi:hypothetical protein